MSNETEPVPLPDPLTIGELIPLSEAADKAGLSHATLRRFAGNGRLKAKKIHRDWFTTMAAIEEYKESRHRGKKTD